MYRIKARQRSLPRKIRSRAPGFYSDELALTHTLTVNPYPKPYSNLYPNTYPNTYPNPFPNLYPDVLCFNPFINIYTKNQKV